MPTTVAISNDERRRRAFSKKEEEECIVGCWPILQKLLDL
jgi:hypothetical protein